MLLDNQLVTYKQNTHGPRHLERSLRFSNGNVRTKTTN